MILQGVEPTIQPLGVGYANRPKRGGMWHFAIYAGLRAFDLTTYARGFVGPNGALAVPSGSDACSLLAPPPHLCLMLVPLWAIPHPHTRLPGGGRSEVLHSSMGQEEETCPRLSLIVTLGVAVGHPLRDHWN